jgi:hypothetical protein
VSAGVFGHRVHLKLWQRKPLGYLTVFAFGVNPWLYVRFRFHGWRPFVVLGDEFVWPSWPSPEEPR